jgi:hypothetical protein
MATMSEGLVSSQGTPVGVIKNPLPQRAEMLPDDPE